MAAALKPTMLGMVDEMTERVYQTLNYFLQEYYNDYNPKYYRRQYDFLRSAVKVEPKVKGNKVIASVFIETDSIDNRKHMTITLLLRELQSISTKERTIHIIRRQLKMY